jgi:hypothetical protein
LEEALPKFYRNLKKSGELEKRLENAARFTMDAFNSLPPTPMSRHPTAIPKVWEGQSSLPFAYIKGVKNFIRALSNIFG